MTTTICRIACASALALFVTGAFAQSEPLKAVRVTADEMKWVAGPTGNQNALIAGDPKKQGMYLYRARFPRISATSRTITPTSGS